MRVDEKEEWLSQFCETYGLHFEYAWGIYYIGFRIKGDSFADIIIVRADVENSSVEMLEEFVLGYVLEHGL